MNRTKKQPSHIAKIKGENYNMIDKNIFIVDMRSEVWYNRSIIYNII